jgi:hypothetical protein
MTDSEIGGWGLAGVVGSAQPQKIDARTAGLGVECALMLVSTWEWEGTGRTMRAGVDASCRVLCAVRAASRAMCACMCVASRAGAGAGAGERGEGIGRSGSPA